MSDNWKGIFCLCFALICNSVGDMGRNDRVKHLESEVERLTEQVKILKKGGA